MFDQSNINVIDYVSCKKDLPSLDLMISLYFRKLAGQVPAHRRENKTNIKGKEYELCTAFITCFLLNTRHYTFLEILRK